MQTFHSVVLLCGPVFVDVRALGVQNSQVERDDLSRREVRISAVTLQTLDVRFA